VTAISGRGSDIYEKWAHLPAPGFHVLTRANKDRSIEEGGGKLSRAPLRPAGAASVELRARPGRLARTAQLVTRFGRVTLKRSDHLAKQGEGLAKTIEASLVEVKEVGAPPDAEGKTALQKNPHPPNSLTWAGWIVAKLGGRDGYPKSKPPGPITFRHGLERFRAIAYGWKLRDV
jgi:hypothetical protein